jgi:hypothetical protein
VVTQRVLKTANISAPKSEFARRRLELDPFHSKTQASADGRPCTYKTMHAAMIMDAAMIANAFPLMPERHPAATAVLSFDLKDMRLLPPLVIRADERRRVKAVRQS